MARGFLRDPNATKELLLKLAQVGFFLVAATSPYFLHRVIKQYFADESAKARRLKAERLRELATKKVVAFKELANGETRIELTQYGKKIVRQYNLDDMRLQKPKKWDHRWRLIIYDIPHYHKKARDAFREKLKQLSLYQLQKSVWVSAYECLPEIEFLCEVFGINAEKNIIYLTVPALPRERRLKEWFGLV